MTDPVLQYRVVPVTRYQIIRYEADPNGVSGGVSQRGEYDNADVAYEVAYALCKMEHEANGGSLDDERIRYPEHPNQGAALASGRLTPRQPVAA